MKIILPKSMLAALATGLLALAAVLPARADYSNTITSLGALGYWPLNDKITDTTATNSGTLGPVANGVYQNGAGRLALGAWRWAPCWEAPTRP
jgi:hypothetical protein